MNNNKQNIKKVEWYDNPNIITNLLLVMIAVIVILSQSFAVNNGLGVLEILSGILNHNISYLLVSIYFVLIKTNFGKKYFDFLNIFVIVLYGLIFVTSLLTLLQSFGLASILAFCIDLMILLYVIHIFLRGTRLWRSLKLNKSLFNDITNSGYFYSILVLSITLLAVNLISTTSFDGTLLTLMDTIYTILFIRYVFLYGEFLDNKGNSNKLGEKVVDNAKNTISEFVEDVRDDIKDFVKDAKIDEKIVSAKNKVVTFIDENNLDEKFEVVKERAVELADNVGNEVAKFVQEVKEDVRSCDVNNKKNNNSVKEEKSLKKRGNK